MSKAGSPQARPVTVPNFDGLPWDEYCEKTLKSLTSLYQQYVKPLEDRYKYDLFRPSWYEESLSNPKPFVTLFGPWSAGKSSFINHLLQSNYLWTGPQPTTAEFTVIMHGEEVTPIEGHVLAASKDLPFRGLSAFGDSFLECFKGFQVPHDLLKSLMLVDTPGVLEASKDKHQRKYDYIKVCRWFTERSDLVLVLFDPTKMDAGAELQMLFKYALRGNEGKVRLVMNKADSLDTQELMRVYGSLLWNLSNLIDSTEPPRVYVGSFWDKPYQEQSFAELFAEEKADLIQEITEVIPLQCLDRKITSLLRRARQVHVHALIIGSMRDSLPIMFGKDKAKRKAIDELGQTYERVALKNKLNKKDFPPIEEYQTFLTRFDLEEFSKSEKAEKEVQRLEQLCESILPQLLRPIKSAASVDPRDRKHQKQLQEVYQQGMVQQLEGKEGVQGKEMAVPCYRPSPSEAYRQKGAPPAATASPPGSIPMDMAACTKAPSPVLSSNFIVPVQPVAVPATEAPQATSKEGGGGMNINDLMKEIASNPELMAQMASMLHQKSPPSG